MRHLSRDTLADVAVPAPTGRGRVRIGIVHFGPGAFHRAHQADMIDRLLDDDPRWGIAAVSLRTRGTVEALARQDGLYTLAIRDAASSFRVVDAHRAFLGPEDALAIHALLADPGVTLVTSTVTEKGYCLLPDGTLDFAHPDIVHDLAAGGGAVPRSLVGWIVAGLAARRSAGIAPFVAMPCDNLADNGAKLKAALIAFAGVHDAGLARWIGSDVRVPSTMVDSITPAADEALAGVVADALGVRDAVPVQREAFTQWVIEDVGPIGPDLAAAGAVLTTDVAGFERAKLRILNGAHSTLAYAGLLRGRTSVANAMADAPLAGFVAAMVADEIVPAVGNVPGLDIDRYAAAVLARFRNPVIVHRLEQIAQDGSQKLPYRLVDTLAAHRGADRLPRRVVAAIGCWVAFLMTRGRANTAIADPRGADLAAIAAHGDAAAVVAGLAAREIGLAGPAMRDPFILAAIAEMAAAALDDRWDVVFSA